MTSEIKSDTESNVSGFIRYGNKNFKHHYKSMIQNMEKILEELQQVQNNYENLVQKAGPVDNKLSVLLTALPKPEFTVPIEPTETD